MTIPSFLCISSPKCNLGLSHVPQSLILGKKTGKKVINGNGSDGGSNVTEVTGATEGGGGQNCV